MRYKRLETGHFAAPWKRPGEGPMELTMNELALLLEGIDRAVLRAARRTVMGRETKPGASAAIPSPTDPM